MRHKLGEIVGRPLHWNAGSRRFLLMLPGPTELPPAVVHALAEPPRTPQDIDETLLDPIGMAMRKVFRTKGDIVLLPGSGRTGLEATAQ